MEKRYKAAYRVTPFHRVETLTLAAARKLPNGADSLRSMIPTDPLWSLSVLQVLGEDYV
jgi:hypothetical protein